MEMVFWFGGIFGAILSVISLFTLSRNPKIGAGLLLVGLALASLLIPSLGLYRETQAYLIVGLVGVGLFLLALFLPARVRGKITTLTVGLVLALYLFAAFNVAQPWNTNPVALLSNTPQAATEPAPPVTPGPAPSPAPSETAPAPAPEQPSLTPPPADPGTQPLPESPQPQAPAPEPTPAAPAAPQERVGVVSNEALCPCLLKVNTGIAGAQVRLSRGGTDLGAQSGGEVLFQGLEAGEYTLRVEAAEYQPFEFQLQLRNNRELTVYLLKR